MKKCPICDKSYEDDFSSWQKAAAHACFGHKGDTLEQTEELLRWAVEWGRTFRQSEQGILVRCQPETKLACPWCNSVRDMERVDPETVRCPVCHKSTGLYESMGCAWRLLGGENDQ